MTWIDVFAIIIVLAVLGILTFLTRNKKKDGCHGCGRDCTACSLKHSFYEDYKNDQKNEEQILNVYIC